MDADDTVLDRETYETVDGLDELVDAYAAEGADIQPGLHRRAWDTLRRRDTEERELQAAYRKAKREWWTLTREETESYGDALPGATTQVDGTEYVVHGINHGLGSRVYTVSDGIRQRFDDSFSAALDEGAQVYVEQGLAGHVSEHVSGRTGFEELDDIEWAVDTAPGAMLKGFGKALAKIPVSLPVMAAAGVVGGGSDRRTVDMLHTVGRARTDPDYLADLQNVMEAAYLPADLEEEYRDAFMFEGSTLMVGRSRYQAREAVRRTQRFEDAPERVHLLVGAAHQPHIIDELEAMDDAAVEQLENEARIGDALGIDGIDFARARE